MCDTNVSNVQCWFLITFHFVVHNKKQTNKQKNVGKKKKPKQQ